MDDLSDDELLLMYANGDPEAFDTLFDRHRTPVYNFACTMLNDFARAEDVMQETFLSVARAAKKYEPRGRFRTWIMRIARNQCLNRIESERRRRAAMADSSLDFIVPPSSEPPPPRQIEAVWHRLPRPRLAVAQARRAPTIDGKIQAAEWATASRITSTTAG